MSVYKCLTIADIRVNISRTYGIETALFEFANLYFMCTTATSRA